MDEQHLIEAARGGDRGAFDRLVAQDALLGAWRGLGGFEGRGSVRSWLYRIATNACLALLKQRPKRLLAADCYPSTTDVHELGDPVSDQAFVEPYPAIRRRAMSCGRVWSWRLWPHCGWPTCAMCPR